MQPVAVWQPSWRLFAGFAAGGVAVLSFGGASYYGYKVTDYESQATSLRDRYDTLHGQGSEALDICSELRRNDTCKTGRLARIDTKGKAAQTNQFIAYGVGGLFALAGASLVLWDITRSTTPVESPHTETNVVGLEFWPTADGSWIGFHGSF